MASGGLSQVLRREQPPLDGDAVCEAGGGPIGAVEQGLGLRGRTRTQRPGQQFLGERSSWSAAEAQDQRGVRGQPVPGCRGQKCAGPFAYRPCPVRAADDDQRVQCGPLLGVAQRGLADQAVGVAEGEGEFGVTGLPGPGDG
ncbi:hypothetical protein A8W25_06040 [Streptomyces sp. ERV7]|uniref:hypothetical protein n=1 Tax=Streptomyces sp. ERV7 TaxID=1322334 RepID=UPI0007F349AB|nr:hypothetical protein [Streptomyces sp. ERV7]OAR25209.1 hypothetical protein A8W25_06040 [Streptomyces sp. ERV7]